MNKLFITTAIAFSALSFASAQDVSVTASAQATAARPVMTTGDASIDAQVKALRQEMEVKIKALQAEYEVKIKAIVGNMKPMIVKPDGSTTTVKEVRKEIKEDRKEYKEDRKENKEDRKENKEERKEMRVEGSATGTLETPRFENQKLMNFFRNLFGGQKN